MTRGNSFCNCNGNGDSMGNSAYNGGPGQRNGYLGDERLNERAHWWYWA